MKKNKEYLLENLDFEIPACYWLMYIENFFGREKTEKFCEYLINARQIMRKNDIRKIMNHISLSVYSLSSKEQIAFIGIYKPIDRNSHLIQNLEDGFIKVQNLYEKRNAQLSKKIKKLGYSYTTIFGNWKDKTERNTYQREKIFIVFGEKENPGKFKKDICNLVKEYNINSVLIADEFENDNPRSKIISRLFDVKTGKEIEKYLDTTVEIIEKYFTNLCNSKFLFEIPYENNKKVLGLGEQKINEYYTPQKQELVKKFKIYSFNMSMYKQMLIRKFEDINYNK